VNKKLTHKQRFYNVINRKGYDRIPVKHYGEPPVNKELIDFFGLGINSVKSKVAGPSNVSLELLEKIGDDFRYVVPGYCGPQLKNFPDGSRTASFPERGWPVLEIKWMEKQYGGGKGIYLEALNKPFANLKSADELKKFNFPDAGWLDYSSIKSQCQNFSQYAVCIDKAGPDFINNIAFGMGVDNVLLSIGTKDPVFLELMEILFNYRFEMVENCLKAAEGLIDIVHGGEDLASQAGLILSPETFDKLFAPYYRKLFDMIHKYGAKIMFHCCGSIYVLMPRLIDLGIDILDVVQTSAKDMDIKKLHREFAKDLCFCGSMDVQQVPIKMTPEEIKNEVNLRLELFSEGGLILGPSHAIQPGTPIENIIAMYEAAGSLS